MKNAIENSEFSVYNKSSLGFVVTKGLTLHQGNDRYM